MLTSKVSKTSTFSIPQIISDVEQISREEINACMRSLVNDLLPIIKRRRNLSDAFIQGNFELIEAAGNPPTGVLLINLNSVPLETYIVGRNPTGPGYIVEIIPGERHTFATAQLRSGQFWARDDRGTGRFKRMFGPGVGHIAKEYVEDNLDQIVAKITGQIIARLR